MQDKQQDFIVNASMSKKEIGTKVSAAAEYVENTQFSAIKSYVLKTCITYANENLVSVFSKDPSRYAIYSNIMTFAKGLDDIHFLAFVINEFKKLRPGENSNFRDTLLPYANSNLKILLSPSVLRMQKASYGIAALGFTMLLSRRAPEATILILAGLIAAFTCEQIVQSRLDRSLHLKLNRLISKGADSTALIQDGFQDEFAIIENSATAMLTNGIRFFTRTGEQFVRLTNGFGQRNPQLNRP